MQAGMWHVPTAQPGRLQEEEREEALQTRHVQAKGEFHELRIWGVLH
jgi:hypothetical protein